MNSKSKNESYFQSFKFKEFAPREQLRREFSNTWERKKAREVIFTGVACAECGVTPIKGKLYLATRSEIRLCGQCYRNGAKPNLKFNVKEKPGQSLKPAKRNLQTQNLALGENVDKPCIKLFWRGLTVWLLKI